jgi:hypothetical protein
MLRPPRIEDSLCIYLIGWTVVADLMKMWALGDESGTGGSAAQICAT